MSFDYAFVNGKIFSAGAPAISANDRGFLHGLGVYETLSVLRGKPVFLLEHLERMEEARRFLKIPLLPWSIAKSIARLISQAKVEEAALRITLTHGEERTNPTLAITLRELPKVTEPVKLAVSRFLKFSQDPWEKVKTTCRARNWIVREEAEERGCFDALFRSETGDFVEGTVSNFFIVKAGEVWTPPLSRGILPGVTRGKILEICKRLEVTVQEKLISLQTMRRAESIWISNSLVGLVEAEELLGVWKAKKVNSPLLFESIRGCYNEEIKRYLELA